MPKVTKCKQCDFRAESWEQVREEVWDGGPADWGNFVDPTQRIEHSAPVYKIKVVCERCSTTKYVEKTCYNEEEKPRKGVEVRNGVEVA